MGLPSRNLEIKAVDPDPERTIAAAPALPGVQDQGARLAELRDALGLDDDRLLVARGYAELLGT